MRFNLYTLGCFGLAVLIAITSCNPSVKEKESGVNTPSTTSSFTMTTATLKDKIKGGWAGQTIGVVYGAPVEFKYQGSIIDKYQPIPWNEHYVRYWWDKKPGLFDDIYTDLNFVRVFETQGLNVTTASIAQHW